MSHKYTKEQLLEKEVPELISILQEMNISASGNPTKESLVYDILDAQAIVLSTEPEVTPKRKRIVAKTPDHVYSATQSGESERFDSPKEERAAKRLVAAKAKEANEAAMEALLFADGVVELPKRKRGRPTKEEVAARKAMEEAQTRQAQLAQQAEEATSATQTETTSPTPEKIETTSEEKQEFVEEAAFGVTGQPVEEKIVVDDDLPDFIVAQMQQQKETAEEISNSEEVSLDSLSKHFLQKNTEVSTHTETPKTTGEIKRPADGVDFIIVDDIPVMGEEDFTLPIEEPITPPTPRYIPSERPMVGQKFHKFKEDVLVNPHLQAQAATSIVTTQSPLNYQQDITIDGQGVLEIDAQGVGFLRSSDYNYMPSPDDVFVSKNQIRQYGLKMGDVVEGKVKAPHDGEKYFALVSVERINGLDPSRVRDRVAFEHLTPLFPDEQFKLSTGSNSPLACRVVDLFSPIGKGQRALIVAQPKTGKTILMKQIANAIAANYPDTYLMMLLVDERPEEVTDMARTVNAEVIASTFDEPAARHVRIAQMVLEKAKRMVECGHDVVIFLDSITRLARAFNTVAPASGKILTGGVDANALQKPKRFFGAARNIEQGGSLTIIATALIDTGSKMDEVIFEEFKGTGNMELQLDRVLANKRVFPAVNLIQSSTRRDDLLLSQEALNRMHILRNYMADMSSFEAMDFVMKHIKNTTSNEEFLATMNK